MRRQFRLHFKCVIYWVTFIESFNGRQVYAKATKNEWMLRIKKKDLVIRLVYSIGGWRFFWRSPRLSSQNCNGILNWHGSEAERQRDREIHSRVANNKCQKSDTQKRRKNTHTHKHKPNLHIHEHTSAYDKWINYNIKSSEWADVKQYFRLLTISPKNICGVNWVSAVCIAHPKNWQKNEWKKQWQQQQ